MGQPACYVLVEDGIAINIIWLLPENEGEFPNAVPYNEKGVRIGEAYPLVIPE